MFLALHPQHYHLVKGRKIVDFRSCTPRLTFQDMSYLTAGKEFTTGKDLTVSHRELHGTVVPGRLISPRSATGDLIFETASKKPAPPRRASTTDAKRPLNIVHAIPFLAVLKAVLVSIFDGQAAGLEVLKDMVDIYFHRKAEVAVALVNGAPIVGHIKGAVLRSSVVTLTNDDRMMFRCIPVLYTGR